MKRALLIFCIAFGFTLSAQTTYTLNSSCDTDGECNWNSGSSWVGGVAPNGGTPSNGDVIVIPDGTWVEIQGNPNNTVIANQVILKVYGTIDIRPNNARLRFTNAGSLIQLHENAALLGGGSSARLSIGSTEIKGGEINALTYPNELSVDNIDGGGCAVQGDCADSDPLPVVLVYFETKTETKGTSLSWKTSSELNNDYFSVERSEDGRSFYEIGTVEGNGTTTNEKQYSFTDSAPIAKVEYYRLKQVDFDGAFEYSKIQVGYATKLALNMDLTTYPNPARESVSLRSSRPVTYKTLVMVNISGQMVGDLSDKLSGEGLVQTIQLPVVEKGLYYLRFQTIDGVSGYQKIIID